MLDIVFGSSGQSFQESELRKALQGANLTGTLYFSYPIFDDADGQNSADALLVSKEHGLVLFDLTAPGFDQNNPNAWMDKIAVRQDEIYRNISAKLLHNRDLVRRRELVVKPMIVTLLTHEVETTDQDDSILIATTETLLELIGSFKPLEPEYERALNASVQRVATIKPRLRRDNILNEQSLGAKVRSIEMNIANLDAWQKKSAISYPEGPQRIRGLAGSGKTIVLALKAAHLHARHPEWDIAVTYYSRALRQQFIDLIRRFMFETKRDEPDWSKIHVMHCWGSRGEPGFYSTIAKECGVDPVTWGDANRRYGDRSFEGICEELLAAVDNSKLSKPIFDAVLVDEAQDLPVPFFRLAYAATKAPKRIVWAYDELQNLGDYTMVSPTDLFGKDATGAPLVTLQNLENRPPQDIILPVCYRNTPWALTTAHGLGFGIYRSALDKEATQLVQMFDEPSLWTEIGYEATAGVLALGQSVTLSRKSDCSPDYYTDPKKRLIEPDDSVVFQAFASSSVQADWIADQIQNNLTRDELLHRDILIILPSAYTSKSEYGLVASALRKRNISSHLVGVSSSRDEVFQDDSIAVTHIHRAKGNEAPMVYVANSNECFDGFQLAKKRNTLFTAITRSRAWVRVCGVGSKAELLNAEFSRIKSERFMLKFDYPNVDQINRIRRIHRDRSEEEQKKIGSKISSVADLVEMIQKGEVSVDSLPAELIDRIRSIIPNE